ncbi:hypothetical protein CFC21_065570 [Triticum aestivum]|uniref:Uncharacterized protein n=2 Tax=Triticum aestivum TaxID=4565 RepID=A0A9R1H362_WHEAT|nr:vegetative cell wall protein gp1-like [Triticum aestivum]KAF7058533.1 hypothetical protein CFC21_065567 [Triticum aestivum]KAF7058537.1 hypothetical protein CFC21_065570 [Triticum aestivum]
MSACPSLTLSCDNLSCNIWFCCGSAKDPEPYPPKQSHVVTAPPPAVPTPYYEPPSELVPSHQVSPARAPPPAMQPPYYQLPSELVPPHHVSPAPAPQAPSTVTTHVPVPPCNRAREPPAPAATLIPAAVPSKRYEPPQPAPRPPVPPNETPVQRVMPLPARLPSKKYEPPPPVTVTSQPSSRTTWPPRVKSKTYVDAGVPPAVSLPPPSTPIAPRAHGSRYPPVPHPHPGDTEPRIESYSQAASLHQEYY